MNKLLQEHFEKYIRETRGLTEKSVKHYVTGLNTINALLEKDGFYISDVFSIASIEELDDVKEYLNNCLEYQQKNEIGHHMYSVSFKHFYRFAYKTLASVN